MLKVKPTTKEQLIYYLQSNISLGTYDKKFINNLVTMYLTLNKPITSNQHDLLDKVILRYGRQLAKQEIAADEMIKLPWIYPPIPSLAKFTEVHLAIKDKLIELRSPFKGEFVKQFREVPYSKWDKDTKTWTLPYCEELLAITIKLVKLHYSNINYDDTVTSILNTVEQFNDVKYWGPTYTKINDRFYIVASTESINEAIQYLEFNDDPDTLARLCYHGITIDGSVIVKSFKDIDTLLKSIDRTPHIEANIDNVVDYLLSIKSDFVLISEWQLNSVKINYTKFIETLTNLNISCEVVDRRKSSAPNLKQYKLPVAIGNMSFSADISPLVAKTISLVNSKEIKIL